MVASPSGEGCFAEAFASADEPEEALPIGLWSLTVTQSVLTNGSCGIGAGTAIAPLEKPLRRRFSDSTVAVPPSTVLREGRSGTVPSLRVASIRSSRYFLPRTPSTSRMYLALSSYSPARAPYLTSSSTRLPPKDSMLSSSAFLAAVFPVAGRDRYSVVARHRITCLGGGGGALSSLSSPFFVAVGSSLLISVADRFLEAFLAFFACFFAAAATASS
mmetsp:Transcript_21036/g.58486  ORF Transcript_21036/g.58486 Transcript_21036/m.58486 type:complete len:217 (+) Transcript_21036:2777-3427(+)